MSANNHFAKWDVVHSSAFVEGTENAIHASLDRETAGVSAFAANDSVMVAAGSGGVFTREREFHSKVRSSPEAFRHSPLHAVYVSGQLRLSRPLEFGESLRIQDLRGRLLYSGSPEGTILPVGAMPQSVGIWSVGGRSGSVGGRFVAR